MTQKLVSVVIPNYNYARYLPEAIESVLMQSHPSIECIVVNNGSTDNSLEVLRPYESKVIIIDQENRGQSGARNRGLEISNGEFVAFLDADDYWNKEKIQMQLQMFSDDTELVYCGISKFDDKTGKQIAGISPRYRGSCKRAFLDNPGVSIVLSGESTALFSRKLFEKVGKFDLGLNSSAGWDFFRRASLFTNFEYVDSPLTQYRVHEGNMSNSTQSNIADLRLAYKKLFEDPDWVISDLEAQRISSALEFTFLKTYIKVVDFPHAIESLRNLLQRKGHQNWG